MWLGSADTFCTQFRLRSGQVLALQCTAEHLVARQDGGTDCRENVVAACRWCNRRRHARPKAMPVDKYRDHVAWRVKQGRWHGFDAASKGLVDLSLLEEARNRKDA
ncbi:HNH endonuclease [Lysobacter sp. A3-1-A15]|uniref:HNH endonuclease n=1 Tax=Novilysobacter viscosus TaxID=3098602 RepID=UPI0039832821